MSSYDPMEVRPGEVAGEDRPLITALILAALVLFAGASWWVQLRRVVESQPAVLALIPLEMAGWRGVDTPLDDGVEAMLRADANVQRSYRDDERGTPVWLYVGYYSTPRGGRPEHTPWACYPAAGWEIVASNQLELQIADGSVEGGSIMELIVQQDGTRRLVHFWYATHRSTALATSLSLTLDHVLGRLSPAGRADGALVRISTPIEANDTNSSRARLRRFAGPLVQEIRRVWPKAL